MRPRLRGLRTAWICAVWSLWLAIASDRVKAQGDFQQRRPEAPAVAPAKKPPVLTRPPRVKQPPTPLYPPAARAEGLIADVTLQIDIDALGSVTTAKVVRSTAAGFDEAALIAARAMTFEPAEIDGAPGAIRIEYIMRFRPPFAPLAVGDGGGHDARGDLGGAGPDAGAGFDGGAASADGGAFDTSGDGAPVDGGPPDLKPALPTLYPLARGRLREKGTRDPIDNATVTVERAGAPATPSTSEPAGLTDAEGGFVVQGVPGELVRIVVASGQHEPCIREFALPALSAAPIEITCTVARLRFSYETVVEAPRRGEEVTRHSLSQQELTTVPGTFGDPLRVIQNLPGVARAPFGLGLLLIRGASPQDSGVYVDGHKVPLLYHFAVGPSVLTPDLIDRIDFYPGGFGVRYGRATAGVVDVTTRTEPVKRVHGAADVDFLDAGAYLEGPVGGGCSAAVAARRSYIDTLLPAVLPEGETVAAPVYWDYQARVTRTFANGERLALFAFGSRDSLDVLSSDPDNGSIDLGTSVMFHRLIATWTKSLGGFTSKLSPSYGYDSLSFRAGMVNAEGGAHVIGLREELTRAFGDKLSLVLGLDGELRFDEINFNVPLPPERRTFGQVRRSVTSIERTLTNSGLAGYAEVLWDVTSRLRLVPGFRFDWFHYTATDKVSVDPRIVGRFVLQEGTALKAGAGFFHQPPQPNQLDEQYGNPALPVPYAHQFHLGVEHLFTPALSLDSTLYFMRRFDLARPSSRALPDGSVEKFAAHGRGRGYGLEILLKHRPTNNFFGWIAYSLSRSEERRFNDTGIGAPSTAYAPTTFDQTHNLTLVGSRSFGPWELGTRFRLVTGSPETRVTGGQYDVDYNDWDPVTGTGGSARRQTFHQLDLRAERTFTFDTWRFSLYLDVQNVYNAQNPEATVYDYRYRESGPVRGLPVLPVLGLKGRF